MAFETVAGSTIAVVAASPATIDTAGFGALAYTTVQEVTDLGSGLGRTFNTVKHAPIGTRGVYNKKGSYEYGTLDVMMAWDPNDAGQTILRTALTVDTLVSVKITKQSGAIRYFTAQVSVFDENFGTVDNIVQAKVTFLLQSDVVRTPG